MKSEELISGVLLVDKGQDMTSHDVVAVARRCLNMKKIGHCGTLDPMATGMLILVLGNGTRLSELLMSEDKEYAQEYDELVETLSYAKNVLSYGEALEAVRVLAWKVFA